MERIGILESLSSPEPLASPEPLPSPEPLASQEPLASLSRYLLALPDFLYRMIIIEYKNTYIFDKITKRNTKTIELLKKDIADLDVNPEDLVDVSNMHNFNIVLNEKHSIKGLNLVYPSICITGIIEYFFSLKYDERQIFYKLVLRGHIYKPYSEYSKYSEYKLEDDFIINTQRTIHDNMSNYILNNKRLMNLIDPDDCHSGASAGWCISNIIPIIFGTYEQRLQHWIRLIHGHFDIKQ